MAIPHKELPPDLLKIGYADFKVVPCTKRYAASKKFRGITHLNREVIIFDQTLTRNDMANVIMHECLHAIADNMGVKFKSEKEEEDFVYLMANGLTSLLKENPKLLSWFGRILKSATKEKIKYAKAKKAARKK